VTQDNETITFKVDNRLEMQVMFFISTNKNATDNIPLLSTNETWTLTTHRRIRHTASTGRICGYVCRLPPPATVTWKQQSLN